MVTLVLFGLYHNFSRSVLHSSFYRELSFFDNYIIPLAKKLKECNVFGVSSDECLNYALQNRAEWEERGQEIVKELQEEFGGNAPTIENPQSLLKELPESALESDSKLVASRRPESAPDTDGKFFLKGDPSEPNEPQSALIPTPEPATSAEVSQSFAPIESEQFYFL